MNFRRQRVRQLLERYALSGVVCRLPQNVLLITGYLPILGNSFVVASRREHEVEIRLLVPEAELDLVATDAADEVHGYVEETLQRVGTTLPAVEAPLRSMLKRAGLEEGRVGYEGWPVPVIAPYTQIGVPGPTTLDLFRHLVPQASFQDASEALLHAAAVKHEDEIRLVSLAVDVARHGFIAARQRARPGHTEADVAAAFLAAVHPAGYGLPETRHLLAHVHVMAGTRAANAYRPYNLTSNAIVRLGDTVLVQTEVAVNGYWAELTRTFFAGQIEDVWAEAHETCRRAQSTALATVRSGVTGKEVDAAARAILVEAGFGEAFKHGLGHGIGFQAINHADIPKLHPHSSVVLRPGMLSNMEPAVYLENKGGLRLNDNMLVYEDHGELLSATVPQDLDWLVTPP